MLPEDRKGIARLAYESINQRNLTLLEDHPGYWETRQVFPVLWSAFPDLTAHVEQQVVEGEWVTTRAFLRGTHLGPFSGISPTGKSFEIMHIALDRISESKVMEHFGVSDWLKLFRL